MQHCLQTCLTWHKFFMSKRIVLCMVLLRQVMHQYILQKVGFIMVIFIGLRGKVSVAISQCVTFKVPKSWSDPDRLAWQIV